MEEVKINRKDFLKIPNLITYFRVLIALVIFIIFLTNFQPNLVKWLFLIAVLSDKLDGILARHLNQQSKLGVILEPIADTLLVFFSVLFVTFRLDLPFPIFLIYIFIFFVGFLNLLAIYLSKGRWFAKKIEISEISISFTYITGIFYLFNLPYKFWLAVISVSFGIVALSDFLWQLYKFRKSLKKF